LRPSGQPRIGTEQGVEVFNSRFFNNPLL
jgi:hypothetical protein